MCANEKGPASRFAVKVPAENRTALLVHCPLVPGVVMEPPPVIVNEFMFAAPMAFAPDTV